MKISIRLLVVVSILSGCIYYISNRKPSEEEAPPRLQARQLNKKDPSKREEQVNLPSPKKTGKEAPNERIQSLWAAQDYEAVTRVFGKWVFESPKAAIDFVANLTPPIDPAYFAPDIKLYFDTIPPQEAMALTLKLANDHHVQASVSTDAFTRWLAEDSQKPIDWLFENKEQNFATLLAERIGRLGHLGDPQQAIGEVLQREEGALQNRFVKGVLINWLHQDKDNATKYLHEAAPSSTHDEAITVYTDEILSASPVTAMVWANTIKSDKLKSMVLNQINPQWTAEREAQYQAYLAEEE